MEAYRGLSVDMHLLGEQVQLERRRIGMTQAELGKRVGVSQSQISQFERGQEVAVSDETLERILSLLEIQPQKAPPGEATRPYCPNPLCDAAGLRESRHEYVDGTVKPLKKPVFTLIPHFSNGSHCTECGTKLIDACPDCGKRITQVGAYCAECGGPLISASLARMVAGPGIRKKMENRSVKDERVPQ